MAGDFNCTYNSKQYKYWLTKNIYNVIDKVNINPYEIKTFHYNLDFKENETNNSHIDYIFVNNKDFIINKYEVHFKEDNDLVSDHHLVMVDIEI